MTTQTPDQFRYQENVYTVAAQSKRDLFDAQTLGLELESPSTSCSRGYQAEFAIHDLQLVLHRLSVKFCTQKPGKYNPRGNGPILRGVSPMVPELRWEGFDSEYVGIQMPLPYSGGLLIADGIMPELIIPLCSAKAWHYANVFELVFYRGILVDEFNRTEQAAEIRRRVPPSHDLVGTGHYLSGKQFDEFVRHAFAEDYTTWYGP